MQTGTKISGALHAGCLGLAVFGVDFFDSTDSTPIQISEVSIITSDEFATLQTTAPETAPEAEKAPEINEPKPREEKAPEIVQPEKLVEPKPEPEEQVAIAAPESTPAPRIDKQSAPKPDSSAKEAEATVKEAAPDEAAEKVEEAKQEQAPKEAATEIVTEAEKPSEYAPMTSSVPRSRPKDIKPKIVEVETPEPKEEPKDNRADEIAKALAQAEKEAQENKPAVPVGPLLTGGEREGLVLAVQKCWNVPVGLQNADNLAVVIGIELNLDGKLAGAPKLLEPSGTPTGALKQAFEAGRRALIRCAPYDLPQDKYEQWRQIEVVFNPEKMVLR